MKPYALTIPQEDRKKILDLFYGIGITNTLDIDQIVSEMNGRYTEAQVRSVIRYEFREEDDDD